jgi:putative membrane protein
LFELVEALVAHFVSPDLGAAYLGTQGDEWDAQKDMAAALVGALLMTMFTRLFPQTFRI